MVDAYSKWPIVDIKNSTATAGVVESLRSVFATYGLPKMIVSDNAMSFMSTEFQEFCSKNGVKHITGPPFNPKNNGQAEIMVKVLKQKLATMKHKQITLQHKIANFLMSYRNAPHVTTGERPCMLMFNRSLRTRFDIMRPSLKDIVQTSQAKSPKNQLNLRHFDVGQSVVVRDYRGSTNKVKWQPGVVKKRNGPVNYEIETVQGYIWRRHADQIRKTGERVTSTTEEMDLDNYVLEEDDCDSKTLNESCENKNSMNNGCDNDTLTDNINDHNQSNITVPSTPKVYVPEDPPKRQFNRIRKQTKHFGSPIPWKSLRK